MKTERRSILKRLGVVVGEAVGLGSVQKAFAQPARATELSEPDRDQDVPLYSSATTVGNLLFIFGIGAHFEGDVKAHTDHVLKELEKELIKAGSSMDKVLKVSVLLHDPNDYQTMNEVYKGRFGSKPPVRTTVGVRGGIPNDSLVEIDCIAHL